jgi:hypothetical protein
LSLAFPKTISIELANDTRRYSRMNVYRLDTFKMLSHLMTLFYSFLFKYYDSSDNANNMAIKLNPNLFLAEIRNGDGRDIYMMKE